MTDAGIAASASLIVAVVSGGFTLWNTSRTNDHATEIANIRGDVDKDIEHLKAKLGHGQLINETQWKAEFNSYWSARRFLNQLL